MGHVRLGLLPRSKAWNEVVGLIAAGADVSQIANATINAAEKAFSFVLGDKGYTEAVWLMAQLAIAAKQPDFTAHLESVGLSLPAGASLPDVAAAISAALDRKADTYGQNSDLGEIAQRALISAVTEHLAPKLPSLFSPDANDVKAALASLGKTREFGELSRTFFAKLTDISLGYFLSKTLDTHLGEGMRFATLNQKAQFDAALTTHCKEASLIVEQFSSDWLSKNRFEQGGVLSRKATDNFASYALTKMKDELKAGARSDAR